jgi:hypothetical protein
MLLGVTVTTCAWAVAAKTNVPKIAAMTWFIFIVYISNLLLVWVITMFDLLGSAEEDALPLDKYKLFLCKLLAINTIQATKVKTFVTIVYSSITGGYQYLKIQHIT